MSKQPKEFDPDDYSDDAVRLFRWAINVFSADLTKLRREAIRSEVPISRWSRKRWLAARHELVRGGAMEESAPLGDDFR